MTPNRTAASHGAMLPAAPPMHATDHQGRPFVYVIRFCVTEESSVAFAIRQATEVLDNFLHQHGVGEAQELVIVYRNRLPGAVTLQIGFPVARQIADAAAGEVFAGLTPSGLMIEVMPGGDLKDVFEAGARLPEGSASFTWQSFSVSDFRPWRRHPSVPLVAPAEFADQAGRSQPS